MGDYTPVPDQPADQIAVDSSSADPVILTSNDASSSVLPDSNRPISTLPAQADIPADPVQPSAQASSSPADSPMQANSQIPADSLVQASASDVQPVAIPATDISVSPPVFDQPEVAPEQVFEASASATVAPQENPPIASDSIVQNSQPNPLENPPVQPPQNTPEIPVISIGQNHQEVAPQPTPQPTFQPVEATKESSIHDSSPINPPIYVQPDVPVNTPSVSTSPSGQTRQESAGIKPEPLQPIQNNRIEDTHGQKSSFGDLLDNKTGEVEQPTINIQPIEVPVSQPVIQNSPPVVNQSTVQPTSDTGSAALRRQHATEARKHKYADHLDSIVELVQKKGKVDNLDVRDFLHVSQTTATDYLHTLVNSGKLKRDGKAKATTYSLL